MTQRTSQTVSSNPTSPPEKTSPDLVSGLLAAQGLVFPTQMEEGGPILEELGKALSGSHLGGQSGSRHKCVCVGGNTAQEETAPATAAAVNYLFVSWLKGSHSLLS